MLTSYDLESLYDQFLDEMYPDCKVAGHSYTTSNVLREVDPTAYRCGLSDWLDSQLTDGYLFEFNGNYYEPKEWCEGCDRPLDECSCGENPDDILGEEEDNEEPE